MIKIYSVKVAIRYFADIINFLILARALMSWFAMGGRNSIYEFLYQLTEPIVMPFRSLLQKFGVGYGIDFSPLLAMIAVQVIANILVSVL